MRTRRNRRGITCAIAATAALGLVSVAALSEPAAASPLPRSAGATLSDFDVSVNGFQFANYGTGTFSTNTPPVPIQNWTGADTFRLWGAAQCSNANATAANCVTSQFLMSYLESGGYTGVPVNGQCFGMAMLSELLFNGNITPPQIDPTYTSNEQTFAFPSAAEPVGTRLQHELYFWWVAQVPMLNSYTPPNTAYQELETAFGTGGNPKQIPYVLSLSDHAITPLGVSPTSPHAGWKTIYVYDNNNPGTVGELYVNAAENSFGYDGGGFNLYGGPNHNSGGQGYLALVPVSSTPNYKCQASGLCQVPGANPRYTSVAASVDARTLDKGINVRILDGATAARSGARNRVADGVALRYTSPRHGQAVARIPYRTKEFTVELRDRGSKRAQTVNLGAFANGNSMTARQVTLPKRGVVRLTLNRETGSARVAGARNVDFDGVVDLGKYDYRVKFDVADRARSGGGGWATMGNRAGVALFRSTSSTMQRIKTTVTRSYASKGGRAVRTTRSRWMTVAPGQVIAVWYSQWRPGTALDIG